MADNTMWYSITTTVGDVLLNFGQVTRVTKNLTVNILVYAGDISTGYQTYSFASEPERDEIFDKLNRVLNATNINKLPPQTD